MVLRSLTLRLPAALAVLFGLTLPSIGEAQALTFRDDLGAAVPGLEVCFQVHAARRCQEAAPDAPVLWPAGATGVWVGGPGHGPVWIDRDVGIAAGTAAAEIVVPRKAELIVEGVPAGASLSFYRAGDRAIAVPLDRVRVLDPARPVLAPSGPVVLAVRHSARGRPSAPDLHRLDAPPGGSARVRHTPRAGWSAVLRTRSRIEARPLPGATVRWFESSPTAPRARRRELAALRTGAEGLVLLSGIEAPMASAQVTHDHRAPVTVHGLTAPEGGLLYQEVELRPGGTVAASILWRGEPAGDLPAALFVQPTDPGPDSEPEVTPDEVAFRGRLDTTGRLRVEHVAEGDYLLRLSPPEGSGIDGHADLVVRVDDRRVAEVSADLRPRAIRGRVTRWEEGAPGYRLHARLVRGVTDIDETGRPRAVVARTAHGAVTTDEDGRYALTLLADGVYVVALHTLDGASVASRVVRVEGGDAEASFRLASESLSGRVVSVRGGGVEDAEVWVRWGESGEAGGAGTYVQRALSRPDGRFEIPFESDRGATAPVVASARKDGWLGATREVALDRIGTLRPPRVARRDEDGTLRPVEPDPDAPAHPLEIELRLRPLELVRGRVVDADGRPIPGAWVASCRDQAGSPLIYVGSARTSGDGTFEVPSGVEDGAPPPRRAPVRLFVSAPGCPLTERLVEPSEWPRTTLLPGEWAEPVPPVVIACDTPPAVLRTHVAFSRSHPLPGERLTLRRNGRVLPSQVLEGHLDELRLPHTTGEDGQLLLVLEPGRWQVYRASESSVHGIRSGNEAGLLGTVALDPWTVTDLYAGAGDER